jgi:hypothetical protein
VRLFKRKTKTIPTKGRHEVCSVTFVSVDKGAVDCDWSGEHPHGATRHQATVGDCTIVAEHGKVSVWRELLSWSNRPGDEPWSWMDRARGDST